MSIFAKKYKVDYCGEKFAYKKRKGRIPRGREGDPLLLDDRHRHGLFVLA